MIDHDYKPMADGVEADYVEFVKRLGVQRNSASDGNDPHTDQMSFSLLHMVMGMITESGEIADLLKKHMAYHRPLDVKKFADEMGDLLFYFVGALVDLGLSIDDIIRINKAKLTARYPNGYSHSSANNRNLETESNAMEKSSEGLSVPVDVAVSIGVNQRMSEMLSKDLEKRIIGTDEL